MSLYCQTPLRSTPDALSSIQDLVSRISASCSTGVEPLCSIWVSSHSHGPSLSHPYEAYTSHYLDYGIFENAGEVVTTNYNRLGFQLKVETTAKLIPGHSFSCANSSGSVSSLSPSPSQYAKGNLHQTKKHLRQFSQLLRPHRSLLVV